VIVQLQLINIIYIIKVTTHGGTARDLFRGWNVRQDLLVPFVRMNNSLSIFEGSQIFYCFDVTVAAQTWLPSSMNNKFYRSACGQDFSL